MKLGVVFDNWENFVYKLDGELSYAKSHIENFQTLLAIACFRFHILYQRLFCQLMVLISSRIHFLPISQKDHESVDWTETTRKKPDDLVNFSLYRGKILSFVYLLYGIAYCGINALKSLFSFFRTSLSKHYYLLSFVDADSPTYPVYSRTNHIIIMSIFQDIDNEFYVNGKIYRG